jgi:hypothetical protein
VCALICWRQLLDDSARDPVEELSFQLHIAEFGREVAYAATISAAATTAPRSSYAPSGSSAAPGPRARGLVALDPRRADTALDLPAFVTELGLVEWLDAILTDDDVGIWL